MSHSHRIDRASASATTAPEAAAGAKLAIASQDPLVPTSTFTVEGVVLEVLAGYGLAHVRADDGTTYGLTQSTPGIRFADLRAGQRVRAEVSQKFGRVVRAVLLGESSA